MGTKVLSPDFTLSHTQQFIELLGSVKPSTKRTVSYLVNLQARWIRNEHQQGVLRSKSLWESFRTWLSLGCNPIVIPPLQNRHSLLGHLQDAMRLVVRTSASDRYTVINTVSTALRYHELFGCYPEAQAEKWQELRSVIVHHTDVRPFALAAWTDPGTARQYLNDNKALNAYDAMRMLMTFLWSIPKKFRGYTQGGNPRSLTHVYSRLTIKVDECEPLVKKSPHFWVDGKGVKHRLISIIGNPLDPYVLNQLVNARTTFYNSNGAPVTRIDESFIGKTLYDLLIEMGDIMVKNQMASGSYRSSRRKILGPCPDEFEPHLGEIIPIQDKAGKLRPIATTVYAVNALLEPLHRWEFAILSQLPSDATVQDLGLKRAQQASAIPGQYAKSTDLSSATDNLPRFIQRIVLEYFLYNFSQLNYEDSHRLAYLWDKVMSSLEFCTPDGDTIRYGTGQPMGVYTSWPTLALTNHAIGMAACHWYDPDGWTWRWKFTRHVYCVCGDDFFVLHKGAAQNYTFMMNSFGVEVNEKKSFVSDETLPQTRIEFCKKLFVGGNLVSGTSPKALIRSTSEVTLVPQAIKTLKDLNGGNALHKSVYSRIAGRYPRILHSIPLEYGGLGFVNDVPRSAILSKDCYLILYYWYKVKQLKTFIPKTMFLEDKGLDSFGEQVGLTDNVPTALPENPERKYDQEWRYLLNRKALSGPDDLINNIDYFINTLSDLLFKGQILDPYTDWLDFVNQLVELEKEVKPSLFLGTKSIEDTLDSYDSHSIQNARVALNVVKFVKRVNNGKADCYLLQHFEEYKDVIVSLVALLDGTASGVWSI